jgi:hypothetical protein
VAWSHRSRTSKRSGLRSLLPMWRSPRNLVRNARRATLFACATLPKAPYHLAKHCPISAKPRPPADRPLTTKTELASRQTHPQTGTS